LLIAGVEGDANNEMGGGLGKERDKKREIVPLKNPVIWPS